MTLFTLFCTFFYIGLFAVGGGLAAISLMQQSLVQSGIITPELFYAMVAVSESTPGPVGINMATYVGYEMFGIWGGLITTAGIVLPSLVIIIIIARFFEQFSETTLVKSVFSGLRPAVCGMIAVAAWQIISISLVNTKQYLATGKLLSLFNIPSIVFYFVALVFLLKSKKHPVLVIAAGAIFGIIFL
jgi:chromate transporter